MRYDIIIENNLQKQMRKEKNRMIVNSEVIVE